jgi:hypothetical protein
MTHTTPMQFADALGCLKRVRTLLVILISLCLLGQLGGFVYLNFLSPGDTVVSEEPAEPLMMGDLSDEAMDVADDAPVVAETPVEGETVADAAEAVATVVSAREVSDRDAMHQTVFWGLALTKLAALILSVLLMLTFMFASQVSLVGQLGATAGFLSAFCWSMFVVVLLVPWQQIGSALACGATFNFGQWLEHARLVRPNWGASQADVGMTVIYYMRFLMYPAITLVIVLIAGGRFGAGYRPIRLNQKMAASMGGPVAGQPGREESDE